MKKFFEEPVIEKFAICSESIMGDGSLGGDLDINPSGDVNTD